MPHEVIMPALGMAQDSGQIVAWLKQPGDAVKTGEALMEVETDKATMEVEAAADGWLAEVRAGEGEDVPVGQVIAIISANEPEAPRSLRRADAAAAPTTAPPPPAPDAKAPSDEPPPPKPAATPAARKPAAAAAARPHGRVLASPKARRLASERGLDLARLVEAGHAPPFHVADLEMLAALPEAAADGAAPAGAPAAHVAAEVPSAGLAGFCDWAEAEGVALTPLRVMAGFAAGALRCANGGARPIHVSLVRPGQVEATLVDPDLAPLGGVPAEADAAPDLVLRDLSGSRLTALSLGPAAAPTVTLTRAGGTFRLALDFDAGSLDPDAAIALMEGLAERIEEPLRHLL